MAGACEVIVQGVTKSYHLEDRDISVLKGIDLSIPSGQITVLLGQSGCGKTTLLRIVGGLEEADGGSVSGQKEHRIAFVFQEPRLMPWLRVRENVTFGLKRKDIVGEEIDAILKTVGLTSFERAYPSQLSGGMQQRASIARAYAYKPSFILMDEPFAALDYFTRAQMQQELLQVRKKMGGGILFVTHSIDEALVLGDTIAIMQEGKIKATIPVPLSEGERNLMEERMIGLKREVLLALH